MFGLLQQLTGFIFLLVGLYGCYLIMKGQGVEWKLSGRYLPFFALYPKVLQPKQSEMKHRIFLFLVSTTLILSGLLFLGTIERLFY